MDDCVIPSAEAVLLSEDFLIKLGISPALRSFGILAAAIAIAAEDESTVHNIVSKLCPAVSRYLGLKVKPNSVFTRAGHTIDICIENCDPSLVAEIFGGCYSYRRATVTPADFISIAAMHIRREMNHKKERN